MAGTCHSSQIAPRISHEDQPRLQEPSRWSAGQMQLADGVRHAAVALPLQGCELMPAHVEQRRQDTAGHARPRPRRWTLVFPRPLRAGRSVRRYGRTRCCHSVGGAPRVAEDQRVDRPGMERRHRRAHPRIRVTGSLALPHELGGVGADVGRRYSVLGCGVHRHRAVPRTLVFRSGLNAMGATS